MAWHNLRFEIICSGTRIHSDFIWIPIIYAFCIVPESIAIKTSTKTKLSDQSEHNIPKFKLVYLYMRIAYKKNYLRQS